MTSGEYLKGIEQKGLGNINLESDTIKLAPMATTHTFDFVNDNFYSDVSADLASGATPITLTSVTYNIDTGNTRVEFDCADVSAANQTFISNKFIIYKDTGVASTSTLLYGIQHTIVSPLNGTYAITIPAEGLVQYTSA